MCETLPDKPDERHIRGQLLRCSSSPALNYVEARGAESGKDFVHKLAIVLKELNESPVWLKIIIRAEMLPEERLHPLLDECDQLCRIISSSIQTAKQSS